MTVDVFPSFFLFFFPLFLAPLTIPLFFESSPARALPFVYLGCVYLVTKAGFMANQLMCDIQSVYHQVNDAAVCMFTAKHVPPEIARSHSGLFWEVSYFHGICDMLKSSDSRSPYALQGLGSDVTSKQKKKKEDFIDFKTTI